MLLSCFFFYRPDKRNAQIAKFEAFGANNEAHDASGKTSFRITRKLFETSKHHENMITFLERNDCFFKKKYWYQF